MSVAPEPGSWVRQVALPLLEPRLAAGAVAVGIVARAGDVESATLARERGWTLTVFTGDVNRLHVALSLTGPYDVLVDACGGGATSTRFVCCLYLLRRGGRLVARRPSESSPAGVKLAEALHDVVALRASGDVVGPHHRDRRPYDVRQLHALAAAIDDLEVGGDHVAATLGVDLRGTLAESDLTEASMAVAPALGRVVAVEPAVTWTPRTTSSSTSADDAPLGEVAAPPLSLREYDEATCRPRAVVTWGNAVLPDTFRHLERPYLMHPELLVWPPRAAVAPEPAATARLDGTFFFADNFMRGHFGHALTEQLSRFWAWPRALERYADLRVLVFAHPGESDITGWELELLAAAGVDPDRVHVATEPVVVERLVAATPAFEIGHHIHPVMLEVYDRVAQGLGLGLRLPSATPAASYDRIFLTRRNGSRLCRNSAEVEAAFVARDFHVLAPEELPLREQVAIVGGASVVAGYAGSALLHLALRADPATVLALTHDNYRGDNEQFVCALRGHHLQLFRSQPDETRQAYFTNRAFHSDYAVDFDAEGAALLRALDRLDGL